MMNSLTKEGKIIVFGGLTLILVIAVGIYWWQRGDAPSSQSPTNESDYALTSGATAALKSVVDAANEISGIKSGAAFNYEIADTNGNSGNFGIYRIDSGERLADEHFVKFRNQTYISEVDAETYTVVAMHRPTAEFAAGSDGTLSQEMLEAKARQFVQMAYPEFKQIESMLSFEPSAKTAPGIAANYFFRWNDKNYRQTLPAGVEIDLDPFVQVGINAGGFIFSYDNTIPLYWSCKVWKSPSCIPTQ